MLRSLDKLFYLLFILVEVSCVSVVCLVDNDLVNIVFVVLGLNWVGDWFINGVSILFVVLMVVGYIEVDVIKFFFV